MGPYLALQDGPTRAKKSAPRFNKKALVPVMLGLIAATLIIFCGPVLGKGPQTNLAKRGKDWRIPGYSINFSKFADGGKHVLDFMQNPNTEYMQQDMHALGIPVYEMDVSAEQLEKGEHGWSRTVEHFSIGASQHPKGSVPIEKALKALKLNTQIFGQMVTWKQDKPYEVKYKTYQPTNGSYTNIYDVKEGVLIRGQYKAPWAVTELDSKLRPPTISEWSDIASAEWKSQSATHSVSPQGLQYVFFVDLNNYHVEDFSIAKQVLQHGQKSQPVTAPSWPGVTVKPSSKEGRAILGSPHVFEMVHMLLCNREVFGAKTVDKIVLFQDDAATPAASNDHPRYSYMFKFKDVKEGRVSKALGKMKPTKQDHLSPQEHTAMLAKAGFIPPQGIVRPRNDASHTSERTKVVNRTVNDGDNRLLSSRRVSDHNVLDALDPSTDNNDKSGLSYMKVPRGTIIALASIIGLMIGLLLIVLSHYFNPPKINILTDHSDIKDTFDLKQPSLRLLSKPKLFGIAMTLTIGLILALGSLEVCSSLEDSTEITSSNLFKRVDNPLWASDDGSKALPQNSAPMTSTTFTFNDLVKIGKAVPKMLLAEKVQNFKTITIIHDDVPAGQSSYTINLKHVDGKGSGGDGVSKIIGKIGTVLDSGLKNLEDTNEQTSKDIKNDSDGSLSVTARSLTPETPETHASIHSNDSHPRVARGKRDWPPEAREPPPQCDCRKVTESGTVKTACFVPKPDLATEKPSDRCDCDCNDSAKPKDSAGMLVVTENDQGWKDVFSSDHHRRDENERSGPDWDELKLFPNLFSEVETAIKTGLEKVEHAAGNFSTNNDGENDGSLTSTSMSPTFASSTLTSSTLTTSTSTSPTSTDSILTTLTQTFSPQLPSGVVNPGVTSTPSILTERDTTSSTPVMPVPIPTRSHIPNDHRYPPFHRTEKECVHGGDCDDAPETWCDQEICWG